MITTKILGYLCALFFLAFLLALLYGFWERSEVAKYGAASQTYQSAQKTNLTTIATLQAANQQWATQDRVNMLNAKADSDAEVEYRNQLQAQLTKAQIALRGMYAKTPADKTWASQPWPADIADQLRQSASH